MTYIIADACVNWRNLQEADAIIEGCAEAGVNAVKFQAYEPKFVPFIPEKTIDVSPEGNITIPSHGHPLAAELNRIALTPDSVRYLYYRCLHYGVDFMCTPMYPDAVDMLKPYVKLWKVRFKDRDNIQILQKIYALNQTVLISTDGDCQQIDKHPNSYYLFCVPEYPPMAIPDLNCFKGYDGYSCHIPVVNHIVLANKIHNFKFIEVHAMLDWYDYEPLDQKVSLTIRDLEQLVVRIQERKGGLLDDDKNWV
jgi:sialic acid synthase SpsE